MQFNVSVLLREPVGSTRHFTLDADPPVQTGTVELLRTPGGVLVRCEAALLLSAECSRCLKTFTYPEKIAFEEVFAQQVDPVSGAKLEADADPEAFLIDESHTIDITEAVRQYSDVAAAMQPLCRPDCPGLCPECGQDLNIGRCACDRTPVDSRWEALAALKRTNG
jgi:uncharacterized protein